MWPLGVFVLLARRFRVALLAAALVVTGTFLAWAVIGFAGMTAYPRMLSDLSSVVDIWNMLLYVMIELITILALCFWRLPATMSSPGSLGAGFAPTGQVG